MGLCILQRDASCRRGRAATSSSPAAPPYSPRGRRRLRPGCLPPSVLQGQGSRVGDDAALDALANDWALIGPIGEDTPIEGWDSVNDYAVAALSGRSTPHLPDKSLPEVRARDLRPLGSSCPLLLAMRSPGDQRIENSPAQLLCQGPFARRPRPHFKKRGFGPRPAMIAAAAAAAAAPSAQGAASAPAPTDIS